MTTRPELLEIIKELDIINETEGLIHEEKIEIVKKIIDKKFNKRYNISADKISTTLRKFMVMEYDYKIEDEEGNELDYNLKELL
jgi:hypothetical protein